MKNFKFTINGNKYEVNILSVEGNLAEVDVNGSVYKVEVDKDIQPVKTPKLVRPASVPSTDTPKENTVVLPKASSGGHNVLSPLPGVILELMVRVGDPVTVGQKMLVLEAMKMENNIESDKAGKITEIRFHKGDSVMQGDVLIVIE
ncbi:MAG: acetyl-CoA carboxylase biotin carboxyl carrier protein subunit [Bacteroidetes bacterium HGW-Bacteroidetes-21]|nr:MAG: acetyl-CoA carboxylase biotin carboxyl carrier protein subunit [Bacteroidetes bacterium HGW-Bacteroidetes-21]